MPFILKFYVFNNRHDVNRANFLLSESAILTQKIIISSDWYPKHPLVVDGMEWTHSFSGNIFSILYKEIFSLLRSSLHFLDSSFKLSQFRFQISRILILFIEAIFIAFSVSLLSQFLIRSATIFLYRC